jgi:hypothetical protein
MLLLTTVLSECDKCNDKLFLNLLNFIWYIYWPLYDLRLTLGLNLKPLTLIRLNAGGDQV